jgi:prepilin-type N-terminal cleavage/methylation domain-containing protein
VSNTPSNSGFSLIEVLCAILVLGIGMVGLTQGLSSALAASKEVEWQTAAALLAAGRMETIRAEGYLTEGVEEGEEEKGSPFQWQQTITATSIPGLHEVSVVVQRRGSEKPLYELRTLLFDPPLETDSSRAGDRRKDEDKRRRERSTR